MCKHKRIQDKMIGARQKQQERKNLTTNSISFVSWVKEQANEEEKLVKDSTNYIECNENNLILNANSYKGDCSVVISAVEKGTRNSSFFLLCITRLALGLAMENRLPKSFILFANILGRILRFCTNWKTEEAQVTEQCNENWQRKSSQRWKMRSKKKEKRKNKKKTARWKICID